jgi:hypothetical protein
VKDSDLTGDNVSQRMNYGDEEDDDCFIWKDENLSGPLGSSSDEDEDELLPFLFDKEVLSPTEMNKKYWEWCYGNGKAVELPANMGIFSAKRNPPAKGWCGFYGNSIVITFVVDTFIAALLTVVFLFCANLSAFLTQDRRNCKVHRTKLLQRPLRKSKRRQKQERIIFVFNSVHPVRWNITLTALHYS